MTYGLSVVNRPVADNRTAAGNRLFGPNRLAARVPRPQALDVEPYLAAWVEERVPELAGRVFPSRDGFQHAPPYLLYTRVHAGRVAHQTGKGGTSVLRVQLDVWGDRRQQARELADRIAGTRDDRGLDGFRGPLPPGLGGLTVWVQGAEALDGFEDGDGGDPLHTSDPGLFRASRDYLIGFFELLRAYP